MAEKKQYSTGLTGEALAEQHLISLGMTCLARRYRGQDGELDLVMLDKGTVVFVEVKYRPGGAPGSGFMAITPAKQRRMLHAAQAFLVEQGLWGRPARFDAIEITSGGLRYVPNAFQAG